MTTKSEKLDGKPEYPSVYDDMKPPQYRWEGEQWYWCRKDHRAESIRWAMIGCIRVGPFRSEDEAERVGHALADCPHLGMHDLDLYPPHLENCL